MALTQISQAGAKDEAINEAKIQISNTGTNGQYLQKQSGNAGGLTWADVPAGVGGATGVDFNDDVKIRLGTGNDVEIYHVGSGPYSVIRQNDGPLYIQTDDTTNGISFSTYTGGETLAKFIKNGANELYHDNVKKAETYSSGLKCFNHCRVEGGEGESATLALYADEADDSDDQFLITSTGSALKIWGQYDSGWHRYLQVTPNGGVQLYYDQKDGDSPVARFETTAAGATISKAGASAELTIKGGEGESAVLLLSADEGDDNADNWRLTAGAGGSINLQNYASGSWENNIECNGDGNVELYYNNSKKLETYDDGVTITGILGVDQIRIGDSEKAYFGNDLDLSVYHDGTDGYIKEGDSGRIRLAADEVRIENSASGETMAKFIADGAVELRHNDSKTFETLEYGARVSRASGGAAALDIVGPEGQAAELWLMSDDGDDNGDKWMLTAEEEHDASFKYYDGSNWKHVWWTNGDQMYLYYQDGSRFLTTSDGVQTSSSFQGTGSPGVLHVKTGGGEVNQCFVGCSANNTDFCGGLRRDGSSLAVELFNASDRRVKNNIAPMPSVLSKLNQIELKTYGYKNDNTASGKGPIAQDLINIFPEKVVKTDDGTGDTLPSDVEPWSIGNNFTWELIKAVQELSTKVETLNTKVAALEAA